MSGRTHIPEEQLHLVVDCPSMAELQVRFFDKYGTPTAENIISISTRIQSLWYNRTAILERLAKREERKLQEMHTVQIPKVIKTKSHSSVKPSAFADDAIFVKMHNLLSEIVQLQKEQKELSENQYKLFEHLAAKEPAK